MNPLTQRLRTLQAWLRVPDEPEVRQAHRVTMLLRARASAWIAFVVVPATITSFFAWNGLWARWELALATTAVANALLAGVLLGFRWRLYDRLYELPFFLVAGVICCGTESLILQVTGGGGPGDFVFPYFLILFGVATLFPARMGWVLAVTLAAPLSYVLGELWGQGSIARGPPLSTLILLVDAAFIALIANRVTTRIYFSEVQHRVALERAHRQLQELDRAKSQFFANISHDLRNPLAVITGPLSALTESSAGLREEQRELVRYAMKGAERLHGMVTDLLELAQLDAGVTQLHPSRIEVRSLLSELTKQSEPFARSLGVTLSCRLPEAALYADWDVEKVERVLMNLLSNALKFSRAGTAVSLGLTADEERLRIQVQDQGEGIDPEHLDHIFNRFFRGARVKRKVEGAGLGLAVAKELVELHGGTLRVESQLGEGSLFTVSLPYSVARAGTGTSSPSP